MSTKLERKLIKYGFIRSDDLEILYTYRIQIDDFYVNIGVTIDPDDYPDYKRTPTQDNEEKLWDFVIFRWGQWRLFDPTNNIILVELELNNRREVGINLITGKPYEKPSYKYHTILRRLNKTRYAVNTRTKQGRDYLSVPESIGTTLFYLISNYTFYTIPLLELNTSGNQPCFPIRKYTREDIVSHPDRLSDQRSYGLIEKERSIACKPSAVFSSKYSKEKLKHIFKDPVSYMKLFIDEFNGVMDEFREYNEVKTNKVEVDMWKGTDYLKETVSAYQTGGSYKK
jgi:hypothetical protein